jgi:hypothetical protein
MRITTFLGAVLIVTIAGMPVAFAGSSPGITGHDVDHLPDSVVAHLAMDSLADNLFHGFEVRLYNSTAPFDTYAFVTRPRLPFVGGICQIDQFYLELRSVDPKARGPLAPMQAVGVGDVKHLFLVIRPSREKPIIPDTVGFGTDEWIAQVAECASHSTNERFFEAPGPYEASHAAAILLRAIDAAKAKSPLAIACDQEQPDCSQLLARASLSDPIRVEPCPDNVRHYSECWFWTMFRVYFTIQADADYNLTQIREFVPPQGHTVETTTH